MEDPVEKEQKLRLHYLIKTILSWKDKLILLGDSEHGMSSLEMLIEYKKLDPDFTIDYICLENFPYLDGINLATLSDKDLRFYFKNYYIEESIIKYKIKDIKKIKNLSSHIFGVEIKEITEGHSIPYEIRCTVCLPIWTSIVLLKSKEIPINAFSVLLCGTTHLVKSIEEGKPVKSLEENLIDNEIPADKLLSYAVADYEDVDVDAVSWISIADKEYTPKDGNSSIPFIQSPFVEIFIDSDDEGGKKKKKKKDKRRMKKKRKLSTRATKSTRTSLRSR